MSSKHIIMVVKPLRLRGSTANRAPFPSIGTGGERTFPGKWSSLTNMRNKEGPRPPSSEGRSTAYEEERGRQRGFQFRQESCNKFRRRIASFRHPLPSGTFFPSFFGNVLSAGGRSLSRSSPHLTRNPSASKRSSTKRRRRLRFPLILFPFL